MIHFVDKKLFKILCTKLLLICIYASVFLSLFYAVGYEAVAVNNNILEPLEPSGKKKKGQNKVSVNQGYLNMEM